jgi:hypothetical protein
MAEIGLDDVDCALLEERLEIPAAEQPLTKRDRGRGQRCDLRQPFGVLRQQRLLDEQQS